MAVSVTIVQTGIADAIAECARVKGLVEDGTFSAAVEVATMGAVKKRFAQLSRVQNKLGGTSTNYWMRASDSTLSTISGGTVTVTVTQRGVALHLHGGTVRPKGTSEITGKPIKFLTIPKVAAAHGKSVAMLRALGVDLYPGRGGLLRQTGPSRDPQGDEMWFALARKATIKANPNVIPSAAALAQSAAEAIRDALS